MSQQSRLASRSVALRNSAWAIACGKAFLTAGSQRTVKSKVSNYPRVAAAAAICAPERHMQCKRASCLGRISDSMCPAQVTSSKAAVASLLALLSQHAAQLPQQVSLQSQVSLRVAEATQEHCAQLPGSKSSSSSCSTNSSHSGVSSSNSGSSNSRRSNSGSSDTRSGDRSRGVQGSSAGREAALAAATALNNVLLDGDAQRLVCDLQGIATLSKLLLPTDWLLAARAAGTNSYALQGFSASRANHWLSSLLVNQPGQAAIALCTLVICKCT